MNIIKFLNLSLTFSYLSTWAKNVIDLNSISENAKMEIGMYLQWGNESSFLSNGQKWINEWEQPACHEGWDKDWSEMNHGLQRWRFIFQLPIPQNWSFWWLKIDFLPAYLSTCAHLYIFYLSTWAHKRTRPYSSPKECSAKNSTQVDWWKLRKRETCPTAQPAVQPEDRF